MSTSYVSRSVMEPVKGSLPEYQIRRVAPHARNPASDPKPFEEKLITFFAAHPHLQSWQGIIQVAGQSSFVALRVPVYFTADCMHCHGDPADAPASSQAVWAAPGGLATYPGDIAGVDRSEHPGGPRPSQDSATGVAFIFGISLLGLSFLYSASSIFFNRVVIHSLRDLLEVFRRWPAG